MKKVLISSFDMEIGGVERSLLSMLDNFDYKNYEVDLMLYRHSGDLFSYLNKKANLLPEHEKYATFRKSIGETLKSGQVILAITRLIAKKNCVSKSIKLGLEENSYVQMQLMWKYAMAFLPKAHKEYDVAVSYLWPHNYIAEKVNAKVKIAWIHTDYSKLDTAIELDLKVWDKYDYIFAVSEECKNSFLVKYPSLKSKVKVLENITSQEFIRTMAEEVVEDKIESKDNFNLVSVARFSPAKGIDNAIKALRDLHNRGIDNVKWYVVGYGGDEDNLKELIKDNNLENSFILLGKKTNPYPYIKACDLYVQPSRYEGKAVTVIEAQILNKPVMITNYPTAKSQLKNDYNGYICDLSVKGIADGIEYLYKNQLVREKFIENCKNTDFSNKKELNKLYKLIK